MNKSILVVDDSATMRRQLSGLLEEHGFVVLQANNGDVALTMLQRNRCDLVLADVNMPGMDGIELAAAIRELPDHRKTPIFVLTTESTKAAVQKGRAAGATAWIVKPFVPATLIEGIKKILGVSP